ncbi:MAG: creatininase [Actinobacteria bacterium]|nr:creatininase [Actinomycetota bacterium]
MTGRPLMAEMTWPEVAAAAERGAVALWSVGATEQHGPHLPLSVDTLLPHELSLRIASRLDLVIAPPQVFGSRSRPLSGGGQGFPGTTSLRAETLIAVVADVIGELARSGFRRIAILNWHGENVNLLWAGVDRARERGELGEAKVMLIERVFNAFDDEELDFLFADAREGFPGWPAEHAAIMETSLVMALRPDLVRTEKIADDRSAERPFYEVIPTPPEHIAPSGVLAEASKASPEKGERLADLIVERLTAAIREAFAL